MCTLLSFHMHRKQDLKRLLRRKTQSAFPGTRGDVHDGRVEQVLLEAFA